MSETPLPPAITEALADHVEAPSADGDDAAFERMWARTTDRPRSSRLPAIALAAAAVLVLALPASQIVQPWLAESAPGSGAVRPAPDDSWEEPVALRFDVAPPEPGAADAVRRASLGEASWKPAYDATPAEAHDALALREALLAIQDEDLDRVRERGLESRLPAGLLVAAEVYLVDLEPEEAAPLLEAAGDASGPVGALANAYTRLLAGSQADQAIGEALAQRNLGLDGVACEQGLHTWPEASALAHELLQAHAPELAACASEGEPSVTRLVVETEAPLGLHCPGRTTMQVGAYPTRKSQVSMQFDPSDLPTTCEIVHGTQHIPIEVEGDARYQCTAEDGTLRCGPTAAGE